MFVGMADEINWNTIDSGEYYIIDDTDQVFDTEYSAEEAALDSDSYYSKKIVPLWYVYADYPTFSEGRDAYVSYTRCLDYMPASILDYKEAGTTGEARDAAACLLRKYRHEFPLIGIDEVVSNMPK